MAWRFRRPLTPTGDLLSTRCQYRKASTGWGQIPRLRSHENRTATPRLRRRGKDNSGTSECTAESHQRSPTAASSWDAAARVPAGFDREEFVFELKNDGFRALAYVTAEAAEFVSRGGIVDKPRPRFARFNAPARLQRDSRWRSCQSRRDWPPAVLRPPATPGINRVYAFDILWLDGPRSPRSAASRAQADHRCCI
jgi:hypothetical protein